MLAKGLRVDSFETDSQLVSKAINDAMPVLIIDSVISNIKSLLLELGSGSCHFIPRSGNEAAHTR